MEAARFTLERWSGLVFVSAKVRRLASSGFSMLIYCVRWSFGGNRLQIKAEIQLIAEITAALGDLESTSLQSYPPLQPLDNKQELLLYFLENERSRLLVWLYPLDHEKKSILHLSHPSKPTTEVRCIEYRTRSVLIEIGESHQVIGLRMV